jgi:hypothetical protein
LVVISLVLCQILSSPIFKVILSPFLLRQVTLIYVGPETFGKVIIYLNYKVFLSLALLRAPIKISLGTVPPGFLAIRLLAFLVLEPLELSLILQEAPHYLKISMQAPFPFLPEQPCVQMDIVFFVLFLSLAAVPSLVLVLLEAIIPEEPLDKPLEARLELVEAPPMEVLLPLEPLLAMEALVPEAPALDMPEVLVFLLLFRQCKMPCL